MRSNESHAQKSVFYELICSIPISVICSHFFMGIKRGQHLLQLFREDGYWMDLLFRSFMAWVMIFLVKYLTHQLDVKKPWTAGAGLRFCLQLWYGFFGVVFIDFIVYVGYLEIKKIRIEDTSYLHPYSLFICIYITVINIYYNYRSLFALAVKEPRQPCNLEDQPTVTENEIDKLVLYVRQKSLVYISISSKIHFAKNTDGVYEHWHHTLEESIALLSEEDFHQVGRSHIIHRSIIDQLISDPESKRMEVVLKAPFNENVKVSRNRIAGFNEWWAAGKEGPSLR